MTGRRITYISLCLLLLPFLGLSQDNGNGGTGNESSGAPANEVFYKYGLQGGVQVDFPVGDPGMVKTFNGIYAVNLSYDVSILKRLFIGIDTHFDQLAVSANPLYLSVNPKMFNNIGGLRVGYHSAYSKDNDFLFQATFTAGYDYIFYSSVPSFAPPQPHGYNGKGSTGILAITEYYRVNEQFWVGLDLSYTYISYQFNPDYLGLQNAGITFVPSDSQGPTMYMAFGFQALFSFGKK